MMDAEAVRLTLALGLLAVTALMALTATVAVWIAARRRPGPRRSGK